MIELCPTCKGEGAVRASYEAEGSHGRTSTYYESVTCSLCEGTGRVTSKIVYQPYPNINNSDYQDGHLTFKYRK